MITNYSFGLVFVLRPGSVAVEFKLTFKRELKDEEALAPLKEGIKNGKMGSLTVDPESLKVKKNNKGKSSYNSGSSRERERERERKKKKINK